jgi:hypothetical protein
MFLLACRLASRYIPGPSGNLNHPAQRPFAFRDVASAKSAIEELIAPLCASVACAHEAAADLVQLLTRMGFTQPPILGQ